MNNAHKELLKQNFENAVGAYVDALLELFEMNKNDAWWVGNRIGRDVLRLNSMSTISLDDIITCVENDIKYDEYLEYIEHKYKREKSKMPCMNLESWHKLSKD